MHKHLVTAAAAMVILASAAPVRANDRTMYQLIALGNYDRAERMLLAERKRTPERPELLLNLAAVYAKTHRVAEARALYVDVLDRPAVALDMMSGDTVSSHDVALRALTSLPPRNAIAAR